MTLTVSADALLLPAAVNCLRLMCDNHPGNQRPACRLRVELGYKCENEPRHRGEQPAIMPEEWPQCFRNREHKLPVRQVKEHFVGEMLGEQKRPLLTA